MTAKLAGGCLCGAVRYELSAEPRAVAHCHCSMCRKNHGAAFATHGSVHRSEHVFTQGSDVLRAFRSSEQVTRTFCSICGSPLLWHIAGKYDDWMSVPLGTLDTVFVPKEQKHIQVASKAPWFEITDSWPQQRE